MFATGLRPALRPPAVWDLPPSGSDRNELPVRVQLLPYITAAGGSVTMKVTSAELPVRVDTTRQRARIREGIRDSPDRDKCKQEPMMSKPTPNRLGRGLNSLLGNRLGQAPEAPDNAVSRETAFAERPALAPQHGMTGADAVSTGAVGNRVSRETDLVHAGGRTDVRIVPIAELHPNPRQPRTHFADPALEELADSIRTKGVLQPIMVRPRPAGGFEVVAGERRWRASRMAGLTEIPAVVRRLSDSEAVELALIENLKREDLTPVERSRAYQQYMTEFGLTVERLAERLSESRASVANYLRLLKLDPEILTLLGAGELGMGQARALAAVEDRQRQLALARQAIRRNLSTRQVEALTRGDGAGTKAANNDVSRETGLSRHLRDLERKLGKALGVAVRLVPGRGKNSGRILIPYGNLDEFERILERIGVDVQAD